MFTRLLRHKAGMRAMLITSILLGASLVGPAFGAPSPMSLAKKALKTAKKANKTAKTANRRAKRAVITANSANGTARSAGSAAARAGKSAGAALAKAGQALSVAQSAAGHSGPGALGIGDGMTVPTDGSAVEDQANCPPGFLAVGGGVDVFDTNGDPVISGLAVTESAISLSGDGWVGAVQDVDHASDRTLEVTVECAKPSSVSFSSRARRRR